MDVGLPTVSSGETTSESPCTCKVGTSRFGNLAQLVGIGEAGGSGNEQNSVRSGIKVENPTNPPKLCGIVNVVYIA